MKTLFFGYAIIGNPAFAEWGYISFTELKGVRVPPGFEVDCELFDPPLRASEIEEIKIKDLLRTNGSSSLSQVNKIGLVVINFYVVGRGMPLALFQKVLETQHKNSPFC